MKPDREIAQLILERFRDVKKAQVRGYNKFCYVDETAGSVTVTREAGDNTPIPFKKIELAVSLVRKDPAKYSKGPSALREEITHINSPVWSLLHLLTLDEILQ